VSEAREVAENSVEEPLDPDELRGLFRLLRQREIALCKEDLGRQVERNADQNAFTDLETAAKNNLVTASFQAKSVREIKEHINNQINKSTTAAEWKRPGPWLSKYIDQIDTRMAEDIWQKLDEQLALRKRLDERQYQEWKRKQHQDIALEMVRFFLEYATSWPGKEAFA
jgi:LPS O-antigen subunit length determinant protein (WzzB/FepE family)